MATHTHSHPHGGADDCAGRCALAAAVGRREFLSQSVLAAAAMALAACGVSDGGSGGTAPSTVGSSIKVSDYPTLASTGGVALVTVSGARLAIVRTGDASFVALSRVCPHQGGLINQSSGGFLCSLHGARFSTTGAWLGGERTTNMRSYATSYDATSGTLSIG